MCEHITHECCFFHIPNGSLYVQNADEGSNVYSTANIGWDVLGSFKSGEVLEMDIIMNAYHWVSPLAYVTAVLHIACNES